MKIGPPGRPLISIRAYSGQAWPVPSATVPDTWTEGFGVIAAFTVVVPPLVTTTPVTVLVTYPKAENVTSYVPTGSVSA